MLSLAQQDAAILPSTDLDQHTEYPDELHKPAPSLPSDQRLNYSVCSLLSRSRLWSKRKLRTQDQFNQSGSSHSLHGSLGRADPSLQRQSKEHSWGAKSPGSAPLSQLMCPHLDLAKACVYRGLLFRSPESPFPLHHGN